MAFLASGRSRVNFTAATRWRTWSHHGVLLTINLYGWFMPLYYHYEPWKELVCDMENDTL